MQTSRKTSGVGTPLASVAIAGVALLVILTYLSLSVSSMPYGARVSLSVTTIDLPGSPLNFSGYQIKNPGVSYITLSYTFPPGSGSGELNLTSIWGNITTGSYTACSFPFNGSANNCGVIIVPAEPEIAYYPNFYTTVTFQIIVQITATMGGYAFFPAGGRCGFFIYLVVGDEVPSNLPSLIFLGCVGAKPIPEAEISVVGIQNMVGLNNSQ
jgi:hypothetical protein